ITWIISGNLLAIPLSYFVANKWVQEFVYQINLGHLLWMCCISTIITLFIGLMIIVKKLHRTMTMNPIDFLKVE
ncbi:MAG: hypothetical protein AAFY41_10665, partial [Bacteroidota bacterium]